MSKMTNHDGTGAERARSAIAGRLGEAAGDIGEALGYANSAHVAFLELTSGQLLDTDLAEAGGGDDAAARLAQAMASLRDAARIIENWQLRQQLAAPGTGP